MIAWNGTRFTKRPLVTHFLLFVAEQRSRRRWKNAYWCTKSVRHMRRTLPSVYLLLSVVIRTQSWVTGLDETRLQGITQTWLHGVFFKTKPPTESVTVFM